MRYRQFGESRDARRASKVDVGGKLKSRSTIGSEFGVELLGKTEVGGKPAVLPRISGRAWIYGIEQIGVDPDDPLAAGFMLSDTWGEGFPKK